MTSDCPNDIVYGISTEVYINNIMTNMSQIHRNGPTGCNMTLLCNRQRKQQHKDNLDVCSDDNSSSSPPFGVFLRMTDDENVEYSCTP